ncbi:hypothetical protein CDL15_Pgr006592 [Punica granatum]|uniref:Uncharacterized protein n=1 Tax=Punica granatum TaxID=22663 RepID=A0A218Y0F2_PUNGR|nr:hypothetical protein CDL15_Pgr006592 [Punica granatum]
MIGRVLGCKGMHLRGARRSGRAVGVHGRLAGGVRRTGHVRGRAAGAWCARRDTRSGGSVRLRVHCSPESTSFTRNHLNDLK